MLLVILGFSLSGYLLPWDQKAYWATTVTINMAAARRSSASDLAGRPARRRRTRRADPRPLVSPRTCSCCRRARGVPRGAHRPDAEARHLRSRQPSAGQPICSIRSRHQGHLMMAAVFAALLTAASLFPAHLDEIANPADADYVPRPEWYFLSLFQLLKYFPGPLELVATQVVPGLVMVGPVRAAVPRSRREPPSVGALASAVHAGAGRRLRGPRGAHVAGPRRRPDAFDPNRWGRSPWRGS